MGGAASFSYWTPEQEAQNERAKANFAFAKAWILEHMYHGIPARAGQASYDPRAPLWIELDPSVIEEAIYGDTPYKNGQGIGVDKTLMATVPTGVGVTYKGEVKVIFSNLTEGLEIKYVYEGTLEGCCSISPYCIGYRVGYMKDQILHYHTLDCHGHTQQRSF